MDFAGVAPSSRSPSPGQGTKLADDPEVRFLVGIPKEEYGPGEVIDDIVSTMWVLEREGVPGEAARTRNAMAEAVRRAVAPPRSNGRGQAKKPRCYCYVLDGSEE